MLVRGEWQEVHHKKGKGKNMSNGSTHDIYAQEVIIKPPPQDTIPSLIVMEVP